MFGLNDSCLSIALVLGTMLLHPVHTSHAQLLCYLILQLKTDENMALELFTYGQIFE